MVTYIIAAHHGLGRHRDTVSMEDYTTYLKMTFIQALVSTIGSLLFLKLSIGFSLIRLSQQKWYTRVTWGFICKLIDQRFYIQHITWLVEYSGCFTNKGTINRLRNTLHDRILHRMVSCLQASRRLLGQEPECKVPTSINTQSIRIAKHM